MDGSAWSSFHSSLLEHGMRPNRQLGERRAEATMVSQLEGDSRAVHWEKLSRRAIFPNVGAMSSSGLRVINFQI